MMRSIKPPQCYSVIALSETSQHYACLMVIAHAKQGMVYKLLCLLALIKKAIQNNEVVKLQKADWFPK